MNSSEIYRYRFIHLAPVSLLDICKFLSFSSHLVHWLQWTNVSWLQHKRLFVGFSVRGM